MARIIELIITDDLRGTGKENDVYRRVTQLYTKRGDLVAEYDPCGENYFFAGDFDTFMASILPVEHQRANDYVSKPSDAGTPRGVDKETSNENANTGKTGRRKATR